jgi:hypothetical protein
MLSFTTSITHIPHLCNVGNPEGDFADTMDQIVDKTEGVANIANTEDLSKIKVKKSIILKYINL